ncbi:hypothetical protein KOR34_45260 [Posidoniimonas corsicana]|uniref:Uncharacterized protein n=1 Tax=Posidoniimonas corsicana TaxID=1938618 RepID=A0A5C5UZV1_9BACT|nr:hypothetical protein [Posidoniimonas corsicana]TWT31150.1 hypothetical protein KOR34_45260 [Posidoniimonas corsicana]
MASVLIPRRVLDSIDSVHCESAGAADLRTLDRSEQFCDKWIHVHNELSVDETLVEQFEQQGISEFEAQRRAAAALSANAWEQLTDSPRVVVHPVPRYADELRP